MNRALLNWLLAALMGSSAFAAAASPAPIAAADALRDLRILERGLAELHPGRYRYTTPAALESEFERARVAFADGSDRAEMFLLASRIAASVRCGHTWTNPLNQSDEVQHELFARADKLPLTLRLVANRFLVTGSAVDGVDAGDELIAIDGRTAPVIVGELMPYLRADGSSDGKRRAQIDSGASGGAMDRLFPLLHPPVEGRYRLELRRVGRVHAVDVDALDLDTRSARLSARGIAESGKEWAFEVLGDVATLTLPTFAFWREGFDWKTDLDARFKELAARRMPYLVIDVRRNEGGDSAIGRGLLAHLLREPFVQPAPRVESAYERVPYVLARHLDTWDFDFFDRTGRVRKGSDANWLLADQPSSTTIAPVATPYTGRTLVLVGPDNSSAGFLFARDLKASGVATLVGRTTGGNLRGLNGGELAWLTLPASGVAVDIPLLASIFEGQPDAGIVPDIEVPEDFESEAAGRDPVMQAALARIARWRAAGATDRVTAKD